MRSSSRVVRSRRRDSCSAAASATRPISSAGTSCSTCRRSCSATSRSGSMRTRDATSPTSWTTRSSATPRARRRRKRPACRTCAAASSSTAAAATRSPRRCTRRPGRPQRAGWRSRDRRDRMVGFTMQGEDLPQPTNRVDLDPPCATCGASRSGGSRIGRTRSTSRAHTTGDLASSRPHRGGRALHRVAHVAGHAGHDGARHAAHLPSLDGHRGMGDDRARRCAIRGSGCGTSRTC